LAGATGAAASNVFTYPLDLIITRLQIQRQLRKDSDEPSDAEYKSIGDAAQKIWNNEGGLSGFYAGLLQDTSKTIADSFLFFLAYNFVRQSRLRRRDGKSLPVLEELGVGFVAGAFSKLLTTPIANVVTRLQTSSMMAASSAGHPRAPVTARTIANQIHEEKGIKGFWSGYSASLILTLNPSLTFFFFETLKRATLHRSRRDDPPPAATFLLAALSKAAASSITYPFSLAKARAQVSAKSPDEDGPELKTEAETPSYEKTAVSATKHKAVKKTVFSTILDIARREGMSGLYEGLGGEVMKGFLSHGTTMILKDVVHKMIIQLYYIVLKLMKKYPSPEKVAEIAKERAEGAVEAAKQNVENMAGKAQELGHEVVSATKNSMHLMQDTADKL
jgi:hypothetical protein